MQHNRKPESGRSMTETIAVLVIIAILTIASLGGFSYLMTTVRRRQTIDQVSAVALGMRSGNLAQRYAENQQIPVKTIVRGLKTEDKVAYLPDDESSFIAVTSFGVNTYMLELQVTPGTCEELLTKLSDPQRTPLSVDVVGLASGCDDAKGSCTSVSPTLAQIIGNVEEGRKSARIQKECSTSPRIGLVWGCTKENPYFHNGRCYRCPPGQVEDLNGNCCPLSRFDKETRLCRACSPGFVLDRDNNCCPLPRFVSESGICCHVAGQTTDKEERCCAPSKIDPETGLCNGQKACAADEEWDVVKEECCPAANWDPVTQTCPDDCSLSCDASKHKVANYTDCVCQCEPGYREDRFGRCCEANLFDEENQVCPSPCPNPPVCTGNYVESDCECVCNLSCVGATRANATCTACECSNGATPVCISCLGQEDCSTIPFVAPLGNENCTAWQCPGDGPDPDTCECQAPKVKVSDSPCTCECPDGKHWLADENKCVECLETGHCPNTKFSKHICDTTNHVCVECYGPGQRAANKQCTTKSENLATKDKMEEASPYDADWPKAERCVIADRVCGCLEDVACPVEKVVIGKTVRWTGKCLKTTYKCAECTMDNKGHDADTLEHGECPPDLPHCSYPGTEKSSCGPCTADLTWRKGPNGKYACLCPNDDDTPVCVDGSGENCKKWQCVRNCPGISCPKDTYPNAACTACECLNKTTPKCDVCKQGNCSQIPFNSDPKVVNTLGCDHWSCQLCPIEGQVQDPNGECCFPHEMVNGYCPHSPCPEGEAEDLDGNCCKPEVMVNGYCPCTPNLSRNDEGKCVCPTGTRQVCDKCSLGSTQEACANVKSEPDCKHWQCICPLKCKSELEPNANCTKCECPNNGRAICVKCKAGSTAEACANATEDDCDAYKCVECTKNSDCPNNVFARHICDTTIHKCVECLDDKHCSAPSDNLAPKDKMLPNQDSPWDDDWIKKQCNKTEKKCVECFEDDNCLMHKKDIELDRVIVWQGVCRKPELKCAKCNLSYHATDKAGECPADFPVCKSPNTEQSDCVKCPEGLVWNVGQQQCVCPSGEVPECAKYAANGKDCIEYKCNKPCTEWTDGNIPNDKCQVAGQPLDTCIGSVTEPAQKQHGCHECVFDHNFTAISGISYSSVDLKKNVLAAGQCGKDLPICKSTYMASQRSTYGWAYTHTEEDGTQMTMRATGNTVTKITNSDTDAYTCKKCMMRERKEVAGSLDVQPDFGCTEKNPICQESANDGKGKCGCYITSTDCPPNTYCTTDMDKGKKGDLGTCNACPENSVRSVGSAYCVCKPGYHKVCKNGASADVFGNKCGLGPHDGWSCKAGCLANTDCPEHQYCAADSNAGSMNGQTLGTCKPCKQLDSSKPIRYKTDTMCSGCICGEIKDADTDHPYCQSKCANQGDKICVPANTCSATLQGKNCKLTQTPISGTCVNRPKLYRITGITNKKAYYTTPPGDTWKMTWPAAAHFCKEMGLRLAKVEEACLKTLHADSGHDCPNVTGVQGSGSSTRGDICDEDGKNCKTLPSWYVEGYGTFWIDAKLPETCDSLRVTSTCGNNHPTNICKLFYPLCVKDGEMGSSTMYNETPESMCPCGVTEGGTCKTPESVMPDGFPCGYDINVTFNGDGTIKSKTCTPKAKPDCTYGYYLDGHLNEGTCKCRSKPCLAGIDSATGLCNEIGACGTGYRRACEMATNGKITCACLPETTRVCGASYSGLIPTCSGKKELVYTKSGSTYTGCACKDVGLLGGMCVADKNVCEGSGKAMLSSLSSGSESCSCKNASEYQMTCAANQILMVRKENGIIKGMKCVSRGSTIAEKSDAPGCACGLDPTDHTKCAATPTCSNGFYFDENSKSCKCKATGA